MSISTYGDKILFDEGAAADTPETGKVAVYAKSDGLMYSKDDAGVETAMATAAAAPSNATYITQTANGSLSAEQALSTLATGLVKVTNSTGVLSTAANTDVPVFTGASGGGAGTAGGVPTSSAGDQLKLLMADATWKKFGGRETVPFARLGASTANISITPSGLYNAMRIILRARSDAVATSDSLTARFNADSTATNYRGARMASTSASTATTDNNGGTATFMNAVNITAASSPASYFGMMEIVIYNLISTTEFKSVQFWGHITLAEGAGSYAILLGECTYKSATAITGITFAPVTGSNFVAGTEYQAWEF
jgi:hypothetical protein